MEETNFNTKERNNHKHSEYNSIPVLYCSDCLSLKIRLVDGMDYCDECGSTNIKETDIFDWEKMYVNKYLEKYLNTK